MTLILDRHTRKQKQSNDLLSLYAKRLQEALKLFYDQIGEDEAANEALYESCNMAWKRTAGAVNSTQSHTHIDHFAFQKEIEKFKQIALEAAIKTQENGSEETNEADS